MKFWGLILICASSSLSLLLPALGLVRFPMQPNPVGDVTSTQWPNVPPNLNSASDGRIANALGAQPPGMSTDSRNAGSWAGNGIATLPSSSGPAPRDGLTLPVSAPLPPSAVGPNGNPAHLASDPPSLVLGKLPFTQVPTQKVGLGIWLLLGPLMLLGLAIWTLSPAPRASNKPSKD
jgi:hypothetical protein